MGKSVRGFIQSSLFIKEELKGYNPRLESKKSKYAFIFSMVNEFCSQNLLRVPTRDALSKFFRTLMNTSKSITPEQVEALFIRLKEICTINGRMDNELTLDTINRSLQGGWRNFYPQSNFNSNIDNTRKVDLERKELDLSTKTY